MKKPLFAAVLAFALLFAPLSACAGDGTDAGNNGFTETTMNIKIGDVTKQVTLADTAAAKALYERLGGGDITYFADDFGGFEKVGALGFSLPAGDENLTATTGDIMLYQGDKAVIFYGNNSWEYTRLGKIEGATSREISTFVKAGSGRVEITLSL